MNNFAIKIVTGSQLLNGPHSAIGEVNYQYYKEWSYDNFMG